MTHAPDVLDASALLAWLKDEPGALEVKLTGAVISSVNWSEVVQKAQQKGIEVSGIREELETLGLSFRVFGLEEAERAADLYPLSKTYGLSLGDRACLATASLLSGTAVTAERIWVKPDHGVMIRLIR